MLGGRGPLTEVEARILTGFAWLMSLVAIYQAIFGPRDIGPKILLAGVALLFALGGFLILRFYPRRGPRTRRKG